MNSDKCAGCKYCYKRWAEKYIPGYGNVEVGSGYYACHFLPYWGKPIETIGRCPKVNEDGTQKEWSLRNSCKVN